MSEHLTEVNQPSVRKRQEKLYEMTHTYLINNFHKFSEANKIKVALAIQTKYIPTKLEGEMKVTQMPVALINGKPMEPDLG